MKVHEYALMRDVAAAQPRPRLPESLWAAPPLVVLNNFAGQEELKLATVLFQNLFPPINVQTTRLAQCQARAAAPAAAGPPGAAALHQQAVLPCASVTAARGEAKAAGPGC